MKEAAYREELRQSEEERQREERKEYVRAEERRHREMLEEEESRQYDAEMLHEERERNEERRHRELLEIEARRDRERIFRSSTTLALPTQERLPVSEPAHSRPHSSNQLYPGGSSTNNYAVEKFYEEGTKEKLKLVLQSGWKRSITNIKVQMSTSNLGVALDLHSRTIIDELKQFELSMCKYDEATIRQHIEPALLLFRRYSRITMKMGPFDRPNMVAETEGFVRMRLEEVVAEHNARRLRPRKELSAPANAEIGTQKSNVSFVTPTRSLHVASASTQQSSLAAPMPSAKMYERPVIQGSLFSASRRKLHAVFVVILIMGTVFSSQLNIALTFGIPVSGAIAFWVATWFESRNRMETIMVISFLMLFVPGGLFYWEIGGATRLLGIPFWALMSYGFAHLVEFIIALLKLDETK